jgi:hypothetical protein
MTKQIFAPLKDDKFAPATQLIEVATVKPSGYLQGRVITAPNQLPFIVEALNSYYAENGRPAPVIFTRAVGTEEWSTDAEVIIPETLPDDFS